VSVPKRRSRNVAPPAQPSSSSRRDATERLSGRGRARASHVTARGSTPRKRGKAATTLPGRRAARGGHNSSPDTGVPSPRAAWRLLSGRTNSSLTV